MQKKKKLNKIHVKVEGAAIDRKNNNNNTKMK